MMVGSEDISHELDRDEEVLWSGRPAQGVRWRDDDAMLILIGLLFLGGAVGAIIDMVRDGQSFATLFVVPHGLLGLYLFAGRFFLGARLREHTHYFVTDRRAVIVRLWPSRNVKSVQLRRLESIQRFQHGDGTVTIVLGKQSRRHAPPRLEWIQDGQRVCQLILDANDEDEEDGAD